MEKIFNDKETEFIINSLDFDIDEYNKITGQDLKQQIENYDMYTAEQDAYFEKMVNILSEYDEVTYELVNSLVKEEDIKPLVRDFQSNVFKNKKMVVNELMNQLKPMRKMR